MSFSDAKIFKVLLILAGFPDPSLLSPSVNTSSDILKSQYPKTIDFLPYSQSQISNLVFLVSSSYKYTLSTLFLKEIYFLYKGFLPSVGSES